MGLVVVVLVDHADLHAFPEATGIARDVHLPEVIGAQLALLDPIGNCAVVLVVRALERRHGPSGAHHSDEEMPAFPTDVGATVLCVTVVAAHVARPRGQLPALVLPGPRFRDPEVVEELPPHPEEEAVGFCQYEVGVDRELSLGVLFRDECDNLSEVPLNGSFALALADKLDLDGQHIFRAVEVAGSLGRFWEGIWVQPVLVNELVSIFVGHVLANKFCCCCQCFLLVQRGVQAIFQQGLKCIILSSR